MLRSEEIKLILQPQFGDILGKSKDSVPLWMHNFTLWSIVSKLLKYIPRFDDRERRLLEITTLIHDIGKMSDKNQAILSGAKDGPVKHTLNKEEIAGYFSDNNLSEALSLSGEDIDFIFHAHHHHGIPDDALRSAPPSVGIYSELVRYADWLSSMHSLDRRQIQRMSETLKPFCNLAVVNISRPEGPANYLLFDTAYSVYKEKGWEILLVLPAGLLLIAPPDVGYPEKDEVVQGFQERVKIESLRLQRPNPTNFAAVMLAGESAKGPRQYLEVHKDFLLEALSDFGRAPSFFLKPLVEMLDLSGNLTAGSKEKYPILDILKGLCGTRGIPIAREKWQQMGGNNTEPLKEMLGEIFDTVSFDKVVPVELIEKDLSSMILRKAAPKELFNILNNIAEKLFPQRTDSSLLGELSSLVSMEEELDFREIALKRFSKYKEYKTTQNPEKGVCESCGSTISFATQKSLNFPGGKRWGFSQISAHTESARATCTLCAFDTMALRKDVQEKMSQIYIRVESKSVDLWPLYDEISRLIKRLDAAFYNPYTLETMEKNLDYGFLPLPRDFRMPKMRESRLEAQPFSSVRGCLMPVSRVDSSASPKDLRAAYMSLYALLKLMGFDVHIGFEEQNGLFGDSPIARQVETFESVYYKGLAIKWLARILDKNTNQYVFAESLLTKSPSVAITKIGAAVDCEEKRKKINKEQLPLIIETIVKGGFKIKIPSGGDYTMKELLQDAAFFAEGIPAFVWSGEDHKAWISNSSKHLITKPVSKMMNCILQGDDFETALAKFLSFLKEDISGDKTKEGSIAKVDISDLKLFVGKAKNILYRYHDLKQKDISSFIQAKNALLSSIFLLKRYPNIKEVVNG